MAWSGRSSGPHGSGADLQEFRGWRAFVHLARELTRSGTTMLFSLHDLRVANCLDMVVVLQAGRLRAAGPPGTVLTPDLLHEVFGVRARTTEGLTLELP